jgi:hypothetical protein
MKGRFPRLKQFLLLVLVFGVVDGMSTLAVAGPITTPPPGVFFRIDDQFRAVPAVQGEESWTIENFTFSNAEAGIMLSTELIPDPTISYGISVIDFGAPSSFTFSFQLPIGPTSPTAVIASTSGSVTNGTDAGEVTVTALPPLQGVPVDSDGIDELQVFTVSSDGGATLINVGLDLGPTTSVPLGAGESGIYGAFNEQGAGVGGPFNFMRVDVNFSLSGGGDIFTLNGSKILVTATAAPEPSTPILLGLGLFGIGLVSWRQKRRQLGSATRS